MVRALPPPSLSLPGEHTLSTLAAVFLYQYKLCACSQRIRHLLQAVCLFLTYCFYNDRHPLSSDQAFAVAIAVLHNPISALLDMLPPLDQVPHALPPPAARNLVCAVTLDKGYGQVYCLAVHGASVFCGLRSGHVQRWQCPLNAPAVMHEWRAHSESNP